MNSQPFHNPNSQYGQPSHNGQYSQYRPPQPQRMNSLPFSYEVVDYANFCHNLPNNAPPVITPRNLFQQEYLTHTISLLISDLQTNCQKSPLRTFAFNLLSRSYWQNPEFARMVEFTINYAEMLALRDRLPLEKAFETACYLGIHGGIAEIAQNYPDIYNFIPHKTAEDISRAIPKLQYIRGEIQDFQMMNAQPLHHNLSHQRNNLPPQHSMPGGYMAPGYQGMAPAYQGMASGYQGMAPGYQGMASGYQGMAPGYQGMAPGYQGPPLGAPSHDGGIGARQNMFGNPEPRNQQSGMGTGLKHRPHFVKEALSDYDQPHPSNAGNPGFSQRSYIPPSSNAGQEVRQPVNPQPQVQPQPQPQQPVNPHPQVQPQPQPQQPVNPHPQVQPQPQLQQPVNPQPQPQPARDFPTPGSAEVRGTTMMDNREVMANDPLPQSNSQPQKQRRSWDRRVDEENGVTFAPAHLSEWTVTHGYRPVYDPKTHVLFHAMSPYGDVMQFLKPIAEGMEYLAHETEPKMLKRLPPLEESRVVSMDNFCSSESPKLLDFEVTNDQLIKDIGDTNAPMVIPNVVYAGDSIEASTQVLMALRDKGIDGEASKRPVIYGHYQTYPILDRVLSKEEGKEIMLVDVLKETLSMTSVDDFHAQLVKLSKNPDFPRDLLHMINRMSTEAVNDGLQYALLLEDWRIDSFLEDWGLVQEGLIDKFGGDPGIIYHEALLKKCTPMIIGGGLRVLTGEDRKKCFEEEGVLARYRKRQKEIIAIGLFRVEMMLPFNSNDMSFQMQEGVNIVKRKEVPNFHDLVMKLSEEVKKKFSQALHIHFRTADSLFMQVHEGVFNGECFIIKIY